MLLAQAPALGTFWNWQLILIATGASLLLLGVLFLVLLFRHLRSVRQLTHLERMRSLEAGFPLEAPEETKTHAKYMHNAFWISFWLVFSVPGASLSAASAATNKANGSIALLIIIWGGAAIATIATAVCATVLMLKTRPHTHESDDLMKPKKPGRAPF